MIFRECAVKNPIWAHLVWVCKLITISYLPKIKKITSWVSQEIYNASLLYGLT